MRFFIGGSALFKNNPKDVDILAVVDDKEFEELFDMDAEEFGDEDRDGPWKEGRKRWGYECSGAKRVLQYVFPELIPIDFKIIPVSMLFEPNKEIDFTAPTSTWGISFPKSVKL